MQSFGGNLSFSYMLCAVEDRLVHSLLCILSLCFLCVSYNKMYHSFMVGAIDRAHARSTSARNVLLTVRMRTVNKYVKCAADRAHAPL